MTKTRGVSDLTVESLQRVSLFRTRPPFMMCERTKALRELPLFAMIASWPRASNQNLLCVRGCPLAEMESTSSVRTVTSK